MKIILIILIVLTILATLFVWYAIHVTNEADAEDDALYKQRCVYAIEHEKPEPDM